MRLSNPVRSSTGLSNGLRPGIPQSGHEDTVEDALQSHALRLD